MQGRLEHLSRAAARRRPPSHLSDGAHTFYVRAIDPAGNADPTPASRPFTVRTAAVHLSGSTLVVTAAAGAKDNFEITRPSASVLRVTDLASGAYTGSGVHAWAGCTRSGDYTANCNAAGITLIRVASGGRNDRVVNSTAIRSSLDGGAANDTLIGGSSHDTLTGGAGADVIKGMNGNDELFARDLASDTSIDCDGGTTPGSADKADLDVLPKELRGHELRDGRRGTESAAAGPRSRWRASDLTREPGSALDSGGGEAMKPPKTQYARSGDFSIAYQVVGDGPLDLVHIPGLVSHLDHAWTHPKYVRFMRLLSSFARVIVYDKRGTGLSDPFIEPPSVEERIDDTRAVMDAVGSDRAAVFGCSEGATLAAFFAATYPERVSSAVLYGSFARLTPDPPDYPWGFDDFMIVHAPGGRTGSLGRGGPAHASSPPASWRTMTSASGGGAMSAPRSAAASCAR